MLTGKRNPEVELSGSDLVWVIAPQHPEVNKHYCFFKNITSRGNELSETESDLELELEYVDGMDVKIPLNMVGGLEVIARKDTRQYEVLVEKLLENKHLKTRLEKIENNFNTMLCVDK